MSVHGLGIGKPRTRLGRYLDTCGLIQDWLMKRTGLSEATITSLCNDKGYSPSERTKIKIIAVLQDEIDPHVSINDFW